MRLELTGRQVSVTPALRQLVSRHLRRLERVLNDNAVSVQVVLSAQRQQLVTDITLHARGDHVMSGVAAATTWPLSVRLACDKLSQQARTLKEKWTGRRRRAERIQPPSPPETTPPAPGPAPEPEIEPALLVRIRPAARRLSLAAALARLGDTLENYVVFTHEATGRLVVLVRRRDGRVGRIELEA